MNQLGLAFTVVAPDIDEKAIRRPKAEDLVIALGKAKAEAVAAKIDYPAIIISSDQVARYQGEIREKPVDAKQAREFLQSYRTAPVETVTSVVVTNTQTGQQRAEVDIAQVSFKPIPDDVIEAMIEDGAIFTCCGGFASDSPLFKPYIDQIDGALDSVVGLPKEVTLRLLNQVGYGRARL